MLNRQHVALLLQIDLYKLAIKNKVHQITPNNSIAINVSINHPLRAVNRHMKLTAVR